MRIILLAGLIPPLFLIHYIYKLDKIEKEPVRLLAKLFFAGCLTTVAASLLEQVGLMLLQHYVDPQRSGLLYLMIMNFAIVGVAEEGVKLFALRRITWFNDNFNYRFDAIVYSVCVAMGFAAAENIMYIFSFGIGVAPIRAITAIPMHCITGIFMGHYYGQAKLSENTHHWSAMKMYNICTLLIPVLLHGFYDFAASAEDGMLSVIFLVYVVVVDVIAFLSIRNFAKKDVPFI